MFANRIQPKSSTTPVPRSKKTMTDKHQRISSEGYSLNDESQKTAYAQYPRLKSPLPSDEDTDEEDNALLTIKYTKNPLHGSLPYRVNRSAPSLAQQLEIPTPTKQQYRHSHDIRHKKQDRSISTEDLNRFMNTDDDTACIGQYMRPNSVLKYQNKHHLTAPMSGMDLLMQREQQKAENKRQKPRIDSKNAKIRGLLSKLPEPGIHNINFQQFEQQQQQQQQQHQMQQKQKKTNSYQQPMMMYNQQQQQQPFYSIPYGSMYMIPAFQQSQQQQQQQKQQQVPMKPRSVILTQGARKQQPYF